MSVSDVLRGIACVAVTAASVALVVFVVRSERRVALETAPVSDSQIAMSSYTNADSAHITVTNAHPRPVWSCFQGKITNKAGQSTESLMVCTGDLAPHTTIALSAPWRVGAVLDLCNETDRQGNRSLSWDKCTFEVANKTAALSKL